MIKNTEQPHHPGSDRRFTIDGSHELETLVADTCRNAADQLKSMIPRKRLEGLLLAGGYGRGEGGVRTTATGDQPYNDLEFFLFIKGHPWINEKRYGSTVHQLGVSLSKQIGIEVEFKITSAATVRKAAPSMFFYDLIMGHHRVLGDQSLMHGWEHHRQAGNIPAHEATRLLMNRCSGLLFSISRLSSGQFDEEDSGFVQRNIAKLQLALGDVVLCGLGQYHWSCRERNLRLRSCQGERLPFSLGQVRRLHNRGVEFKLRPVIEVRPRHILSRELTSLLPLAWQVWRWLEESRLGGEFANPADYSLNQMDKCPEVSRLRRVSANLKAFGVRGVFSGRRYPRERLLNALPLMLWEPTVFKEPAHRKWLCKQLRTNTSWGARQYSPSSAPESGPLPIVPSYDRLWHQFN